MQQSERFQSLDHSALARARWENASPERRLLWAINISGGQEAAHERRANEGDGDTDAPGFTMCLRGQIRERDGERCVVCSAENGPWKLVVHHIDQDRSNNDPTNLITLCRSCHNRGHNLGFWPIDLKAKAIINEATRRSLAA